MQQVYKIDLDKNYLSNNYLANRYCYLATDASQEKQVIKPITPTIVHTRYVLNYKAVLLTKINNKDYNNWLYESIQKYYKSIQKYSWIKDNIIFICCKINNEHILANVITEYSISNDKYHEGQKILDKLKNNMAFM